MDLEGIFGQDGVLAKKIANYRLRPQQQAMAQSVHDAIVQHQRLVVEAATGTGKTYAYLIPALLSGKKVLIATATKTLQDQLVHQDIPQILATLGIAKPFKILKDVITICVAIICNALLKRNHMPRIFIPWLPQFIKSCHL